MICPAREWGVKKVFLKQHRWYAVEMASDKVSKIKYLALYEKKPVKAVRYIGEIKEIRPYKDSGKFEILLKGEPLKINPIKRSKENPKLAPQSRQYTNRKLMVNAEWLEDIFPKNN